MKVITVDFSQQILDYIDFFIKNGLFTSRCEFIRASIFDFLDKKIDEKAIFISENNIDELDRMLHVSCKIEKME